MRNTRRSTAAIILALTSPLASADPVPMDDNANIELKQTFESIGANSFRLDWQGVEGTAYFTQWSTDLEEFYYLPEVDLGTIHDPIDFTPLDGMGNPYPKIFVRLQTFSPSPLDPKNADFDGDGISNWLELTVYGPIRSEPIPMATGFPTARTTAILTDSPTHGKGWSSPTVLIRTR